MRETVTGWGRFSKSPVQPQPVPELTPRSSLQLVGHGLAREVRTCFPLSCSPVSLSLWKSCPYMSRPRPICVNTATLNRCPPEHQHSSSRLSVSPAV